MHVRQLDLQLPILCLAISDLGLQLVVEVRGLRLELSMVLLGSCELRLGIRELVTEPGACPVQLLELDKVLLGQLPPADGRSVLLELLHPLDRELGLALFLVLRVQRLRLHELEYIRTLVVHVFDHRVCSVVCVVCVVFIIIKFN